MMRLMIKTIKEKLNETCSEIKLVDNEEQSSFEFVKLFLRQPF